MSNKQKKWIASVVTTAKEMEATPLPFHRTRREAVSARMRELKEKRRAVA